MKARLLTGSYTLQFNRAKFNQFRVNPLSPLCKQAPETREHFIVTCKCLKDIRSRYLRKIRDIFGCSSSTDHILQTPELCIQLLLDSSHPCVSQCLELSEKQTVLLELRSRELIYALHLKRVRLLNAG